MNNTSIVAHRGWCQKETENTLNAIKAAKMGGCRAVEFDVRITADGHWVLHHDASLERIYNNPLVVSKSTLIDLQQYGEITTLEAVLPLFDEHFHGLIENKETSGELATSFHSLLASQASTKKHFSAICRGKEMAGEMRKLNPKYDLIYYDRHWDNLELFRRGPLKMDGFDIPAKHRQKAPSGSFPSESSNFEEWSEEYKEEVRERIKMLRQDGMKLAIFTVNDVEEGEFWQSTGIEWLITDKPWLFLDS